jgi:hypothetical protein
MGFTFSRLPASARARPMRPPFARNSNVSTVKSRPASRRCPAASASTSSSVVPRSSRRWIPRPSIEIPTEADSVSTSRTRSPPSSPAASVALAKVPESLDEMCSE